MAAPRAPALPSERLHHRARPVFGWAGWPYGGRL